jgi:hypothetical protein
VVAVAEEDTISPPYSAAQLPTPATVLGVVIAPIVEVLATKVPTENEDPPFVENCIVSVKYKERVFRIPELHVVDLMYA